MYEQKVSLAVQHKVIKINLKEKAKEKVQIKIVSKLRYEDISFRYTPHLLSQTANLVGYMCQISVSIMLKITNTIQPKCHQYKDEIALLSTECKLYVLRSRDCNKYIRIAEYKQRSSLENISISKHIVFNLLIRQMNTLLTSFSAYFQTTCNGERD